MSMRTVVVPLAVLAAALVAGTSAACHAPDAIAGAAAASVRPALEHVKLAPPSGAVAFDTATSAAIRGPLGKAAASLGMRPIDFAPVLVCENLRCRFGGENPPDVIVSVQGVNARPAVQFHGDSAVVTLAVWWSYEADGARRAEGRIIEVRLSRRGDTWLAGTVRSLYEGH